MKPIYVSLSLASTVLIAGCDAVRLPWVEPMTQNPQQERDIPPPPPLEPINPILLDGELIDVPGKISHQNAP